MNASLEWLNLSLTNFDGRRERLPILVEEAAAALWRRHLLGAADARRPPLWRLLPRPAEEILVHRDAPPRTERGSDGGHERRRFGRAHANRVRAQDCAL